MGRRKLYLLFLSVLGASAVPAQATSDSAKQEKWLYLLVGQSNMAGRGEIAAQDLETNARIESLSNDPAHKDEWVPAKEPLHFDIPKAGNRQIKSGVGPGLAFARVMAAAHPTISIGLIPCAVGGTTVQNWSVDSPPGDPRCFREAVRRARLAMRSGALKGILWQQGESDSNDAERANAYHDRLREVLERLRRELDAPGVPIVIGGLGDYFLDLPGEGKGSAHPFASQLNAVLRRVADELPPAVFVPASRLGSKPDHLHFSADAERENGVLMACALLELTRSK